MSFFVDQPERIEPINQSHRLTISQSSLRHSQIALNELVIESEIGEGSFGKVCLGRWREAPVALKFCKNKGKVDEFMNEMRLMLYVV